MTSGGGDNGGFKGLFGSIAKAIGGAFVEGLERQMQQHLTTELSNPNLASRNQTAMRLRAVLSRPEFALDEKVSEVIDLQLKAALASADASTLVATLSKAVRTSGWKAMQRLMFYQLVAPHPNVNVSLGTGGAPSAPVGDELPPEPPPADRPDYLRLVTEGSDTLVADEDDGEVESVADADTDEPEPRLAPAPLAEVPVVDADFGDAPEVDELPEGADAPDSGAADAPTDDEQA